MRYITNADGYVQDISFGANFTCGGATCKEYTGALPATPTLDEVAYKNIEDWYMREHERLYAWKVVDGNLVYDSTAEASDKCAYIERRLLLWQNPSSGKSFDAKKIDLDLSTFDYVEILYRYSTTSSARKFEKIPVGKQARTCVFANMTSSTTPAVIRSRVATVTTEGVEFTDGTDKNLSTNALETANGAVVPVQIIGLRGPTVLSED